MSLLGDPVDFAALPGWTSDDHASALAAFYKSAATMAKRPPRSRALGVKGEKLAEIANWLFHLDEGVLGGEARQFFEDHFVPRPIKPSTAPKPGERGFVTGYYEPEVLGSRIKSAEYQAPLLRRPADLVEVADLPEHERPADWDADMRFARKTKAGIEPYFERREIFDGALDGQGLELVYLKDPIDAFFIHIQGSARIRLDDGSVMRVTYAAKSGHAYTPIGRVLIERGEIARENMSMQAIRTWLNSHVDQQKEVMSHNRSYIFFDEVTGLDPEDGPIGAGKVPLYKGRSLAVDRTLHTFGTPIYLNADLDGGFQRLMVAQDTGSAIVGPARGDIYFGSGLEAEKIAGKIQHAADFHILWPKHQSLDDAG